MFAVIEERIRIEPLTSKRSEVGRRVSFACSAYRGDGAKFAWTKNGKIVHTGIRIGIHVVDGEISTLTLKDVTSEDSGNYTCIASNEVSEDRSTAALVVEG